MSANVYVTLHIVGLVLLFFSLGGMTINALNESTKGKVWLMATHGVAMLILLVAGFGAAAKLGYMKPFPGWLGGKLVLWLVLGAAPVLIKRKPGLARILFFLLPALGAVGAVLVRFKPGG